MSAHVIRPGQQIPDAELAEFVGGKLATVSSHRVMLSGRAIVTGLPGAFTPVCTERHVPQLIQAAAKLRLQGFDQIVCVVASDPFATAAWASQFRSSGQVRFLSDGNLSFARSLGLLANGRMLHLGQRSERYLITATNGIVDAVRVERLLTDYALTDVNQLLLDVPERHQFG